VTDQDIVQIKEKLDAELFRVSAKLNRNVSEMFDYAASEVRKKFPVDCAESPAKPRKCCC